jgi:hypothetical protein
MPPALPSFARDFPEHPGLAALVAAFVRGDYARVRAEAPKLAASSSEPEGVRLAARTLLDRTKPDPLAVWLIVATGLLLLVLTTYWAVYAKAPLGSGASSGSGSTGAHIQRVP